jgi:hypothetical protein
MAFTHTVSKSYKTDAGTTSSINYVKTGPSDLNYDGVIAPNTTNHEVDLVFTHASMTSICIYATGAVTIKSNSSSAPDNTVTMTDGQQIIWNSNEAGTNPFVTADVTKIFITNASSTVTSTVKIRILLNLA